MPYNILPGACSEQQYTSRVAPSQNLAWSPLADVPVVINAVSPMSPIGSTTAWVYTNTAGVYLPYVFDPNAIGNPLATLQGGGYAVQWIPPTATFGVQFNALSNKVLGGVYNVTVRCRSTVTPPGGASLNIGIKSSGGALSFNINNTFDLSALGSTYQVFTWTTPSIISTAQGIAVIISDGTGFGFNGLLIDYIAVTQVSSLADSTQIADRGLTTWPSSGGPVVTTSPLVYDAQGMYHEYWGIETALAALSATNTVTQWSCSTGGGRQGVGWANINTLAGYRLVVLNNIDALSLGSLAAGNQRQWLAQYVNNGGRVLFTGGVFGCGRGYWQGSDVLVPALPCTFTNFDLQPSTSPQVFQLSTGGIYSSTLSGPPVSLWQHALTPVAGAAVQATVGGNPAIVTGTYGTGKVAVCGLTPHGVIGSNAVWWNDSRWSADVMQPLLNWLLT